MTDDDICGATNTTDGTPCHHPAGENGRCWIPSHNDPDVETGTGGRPREAPGRAAQEQIADVIEHGGSIREACRRVGVHPQTFYRWMEYGAEDPNSPFGEFRDRITRARGEGEGHYRQALIEIAKEVNDTATLMSMIKSRYPDSWEDVERGKQVGGVVIDLGDDDVFEIDEDTLEVVEEPDEDT